MESLLTIIISSSINLLRDECWYYYYYYYYCWPTTSERVSTRVCASVTAARSLERSIVKKKKKKIAYLHGVYFSLCIYVTRAIYVYSYNFVQSTQTLITYARAWSIVRARNSNNNNNNNNKKKKKKKKLLSRETRSSLLCPRLLYLVIHSPLPLCGVLKRMNAVFHFCFSPRWMCKKRRTRTSPTHANGTNSNFNAYEPTENIGWNSVPRYLRTIYYSRYSSWKKKKENKRERKRERKKKKKNVREGCLKTRCDVRCVRNTLVDLLCTALATDRWLGTNFFLSFFLSFFIFLFFLSFFLSSFFFSFFLFFNSRRVSKSETLWDLDTLRAVENSRLQVSREFISPRGASRSRKLGDRFTFVRIFISHGQTRLTQILLFEHADIYFFSFSFSFCARRPYTMKFLLFSFFFFLFPLKFDIYFIYHL